jgi:hypothetical protein
MKDRIEKELRSAAPRAERGFVTALAAEIPAPRGRRSRTAFASAVAVMVLGIFASFGGVGYAAEGATNAADAAKNAVTKTSASDQYGTSTPVKPADPAEPTIVVAGATATPSTSTLPFTGLSLIGTVGIGIALFAVGLALRRREDSA